MQAHDPMQEGPALDLNHLERGSRYRATTRHGVAVGEYLGLEAPFGERAILLRHDRHTASIALDDLESITRAA